MFIAASTFLLLLEDGVAPPAPKIGLKLTLFKLVLFTAQILLTMSLPTFMVLLNKKESILGDFYEVKVLLTLITSGFIVYPDEFIGLTRVFGSDPPLDLKLR